MFTQKCPAHPGKMAPVTALLAGLLWGSCSTAQMIEPRAALEDARLYFAAPVRWDQNDWLHFGTALLAVGTAHEFDSNLRDHFVKDPVADLNAADTHSTRDALPAAALLAGTWAYAALIHSRDGYHETGSLLEAGVLSAASTTLLKYAFARQRPHDTTNPDRWFENGDSFPSGHASLAFALGTVFAESGSDRYRWIRRALGYGAAGVTAYWRISDNAHWTSDVVAGAALGFSTAQFVINRREHTRRQSTATLLPVEGGLLVTWSLPLE